MASEPVTEHGILMSDGGFHVRNPAPEIERIFPAAEWIQHLIRSGAHVYRRRVIVVEEWIEIKSP